MMSMSSAAPYFEPITETAKFLVSFFNFLSLLHKHRVFNYAGEFYVQQRIITKHRGLCVCIHTYI